MILKKIPRNTQENRRREAERGGGGEMKKIMLAFLAVSFICGAAFAQNVDAPRTEIHSKLRDKRCNMPLSECNCPEAKEMKGYIGRPA